MSLALASLIEEQFAEFIFDICGTTGTNLDPDLPVPQRLKSCDGGYLFFDGEYNKGPLVRIAVTTLPQVQDAVGFGGDNRAGFWRHNFTVAGLTAPFATKRDAARAARLMEEIIRLRLLVADMSSIVTDYTYEKLEYAVMLLNQNNGFDMVTLSQGDVRYVGVFWQEWQITDEARSG